MFLSQFSFFDDFANQSLFNFPNNIINSKNNIKILILKVNKFFRILLFEYCSFFLLDFFSIK